jgi:hypothetical protein
MLSSQLKLSLSYYSDLYDMIVTSLDKGTQPFVVCDG